MDSLNSLLVKNGIAKTKPEVKVGPYIKTRLETKVRFDLKIRIKVGLKANLGVGLSKMAELTLLEVLEVELCAELWQCGAIVLSKTKSKNNEKWNKE